MIYVQVTCEASPDNTYNEYYCVSGETYNWAVDLFEQSHSVEINFETLDGETINGFASGIKEAV